MNDDDGKIAPTNGVPEAPDLTPEGIQKAKEESAKQIAEAIADLTIGCTKLPPSLARDIIFQKIDKLGEDIAKVFNKNWRPKGKIYLLGDD